MPCWALLVDLIRGILSEVIALGPVFSNQVKSMIWVAIVCPRVKLSLGSVRWMIAGKKPSMLEKWWGVSLGLGLNCLFVREASSSARRRPRIVTVSAASFRRGGIVMIGVFKGVMLEVIKRQEEVKGVKWCMPPIFRMSCSSFRLWIIEPEQRKSIALKNAWVQM